MAKGLKHYKQSRYKVKRKPVNRMLLVILAATLVILLGSIALGHYLGGLAKETSDESTDAAASGDVSDFPHNAVPVCLTVPLTLPDERNENALRDALRGAADRGAGCVCLPLLLDSGAPAYDSRVYRVEYSAQPAENAVDLSLLCAEAHSMGLRVCGLFPLLRDGMDSGEREHYECALLSEIAGCGTDEVFFLPEEGNGTGFENFCRRVRTLCPSLALGIVTDGRAIAADPYLPMRLSDTYDVIAADLRGIADTARSERNEESESDEESEAETGEETQTAQTGDTVCDAIRALSLTAERYGMRFLLYTSDAADFPDAMTAAGERLMLIPDPC